MGTTTTTTTEVRYDRDGFPLKPCTRCGGNGAFGPTSVHGGACFQCSGSGWSSATKRVAQARADLANARQRQRSINTLDLAVGEQIAYRKTWRTIEAIAYGEPSIWQEVDGVKAVHSRRTTITLDGGEVVIWPSNVAHRRGGVDVAAFLAQAGVKA